MLQLDTIHPYSTVKASNLEMFDRSEAMFLQYRTDVQYLPGRDQLYRQLKNHAYFYVDVIYILNQNPSHRRHRSPSHQTSTWLYWPTQDFSFQVQGTDFRRHLLVMAICLQTRRMVSNH